MYVYVSEYARMWHEYSFGFEIAYRCLIWWLRKKVFQKNLFYIFQCVLLSFLFLSFALHFYVARKWSKKEKKMLKLPAFRNSIRNECAKFQSVSILFKRFTFFSYVFHSHVVIIIALTLSTNLVQFPLNRNGFVINCWLLMYVWTFSLEEYFITSNTFESKRMVASQLIFYRKIFT